MSDNANTAGLPELRISRSVDAPRDLVWQAWTSRESLAQWWGPKGFGMEVLSFDLRPGGLFHYLMRTPDGKEMWGRFIYQEIEPPLKLTYISGFADAQGEPAGNPWGFEWPQDVLNTLAFEEQDGKTTIHLHSVPINASAAEVASFEKHIPSMNQGFSGTLDALDAHLAELQQSK